MIGSNLIKEIEQYTRLVERCLIRPDDLEPCVKCQTSSELFKTHCKRKRRFNVIVAYEVISMLSWLVRFMCPECGKTVPYYPDFALPHKHYAIPSISPMVEDYIDKPKAVYERTVLSPEGSLINETNDKALSSSTLHRWMSTLGSFVHIGRKAIEMIQDWDPQSTIARDLSNLTVLKKKYRSEARKEALLNCLKLIVIEKIFKKTFRTSIFTNLARTCGFR